MSAQISHPHVERKPGVRGGKPVIRGTGFPVSAAVVYVLRQGMTPEELVKTFPHLTLAQIYDALSFYYDHREEMDPLVAERVAEDSLARSLPPGEIYLLRYNPRTEAFEIEAAAPRPPSKIVEE